MSESTVVNSLHYMLKKQYIADIQDTNPNVKVQSDIPITYSDIVVWFSNKDCSDSLDLAKQIWDSTPKYVGLQAPIDLYFEQYSKSLSDTLRKFKELMDVLRQIQKVSSLSKKLMESVEDKPVPGVESITFTMLMKFVEESNVFDCSAEYFLQVKYKDYSQEVKGEFQPYSKKLLFEQEISLEIGPEIGTLQINLLQKKAEKSTIIAHRNLDPFTSSLRDDEVYFRLQIQDQENQYLNLSMDQHITDKLSGGQLKDLLIRRVHNLEKEYHINYKKCHLYKTKLKVMIRPFPLITLDDDGLYFIKDSNKKTKACATCSIF